jgi:hypothetical protein
MDMEIKDYSPNQYFTEYSKVDGIQTITILNNQSTLHSITKLDIFNKLKESSIFSFDNRYLVNVFYSIIPDTRAAGVSIVGEP